MQIKNKWPFIGCVFGSVAFSTSIRAAISQCRGQQGKAHPSEGRNLSSSLWRAATWVWPALTRLWKGNLHPRLHLRNGSPFSETMAAVEPLQIPHRTSFSARSFSILFNWVSISLSSYIGSGSFTGGGADILTFLAGGMILSSSSSSSSLSSASSSSSSSPSSSSSLACKTFTPASWRPMRDVKN